MKKRLDIKRLILLNLPYVFAFYFVDKLASVFRLAPGTELVDKLTGGFANVDMAILGKEAKKKFFADANVQKMMDNRRMNMGEINPRDLPNGVKYLGHLSLIHI